jgi:hypothetical protein
MGYIMYGNQNGFASVKEQIDNPSKVFGSINEVFNEIVQKSRGTYSIGDLYLKYHGYDSRIDKNVYIITTTRCGTEDYIELYGCPQFVRYLVEIDLIRLEVAQ